MAWIYIIVAAALEACWMFSLKFLSFEKFNTLTLNNIFNSTEMKIWLPLAGYIFFGAANTYFFSLAMKNIPTAIAFTVWTAVSLVLIKVVEITIFQEKFSLPEFFFLTLIVIGIIGLKMFAKG
jgi:quaternary ammonium compound-resistance protein SugE